MSQTPAAELQADELSGPPATLLMPLWARAQEARRPDAILRDTMAEKIVESLSFDFSTFVRKRVPTADYCLRASIIDALSRQFLQDHPEATVVEFGSGLDGRFERLDNGKIRWFEVDFPEVIRLRRRYFAESARRQMFAGSIVDSEWMDSIEHTAGQPLLFVAEGVFYFLTPVEVRRLCERLSDRFPGCRLIFDAQSPFFLWISNLRHPLRSSHLTFSLRGQGGEIEKWDERFRVERFVGFGDSPYYDQARSRLSLTKRLAISLRFITRPLFKIVQLELRHTSKV